MFDLTVKDKPRSAFGKLKDRVTGRKRGDVESSSAIVPGRYAALSGSPGQPFGGGEAAAEARDADEDKRSKMKDFFKGRLRKSSDTRSCTSLASESSVSSMASDNPVPPPTLDLLSDPPSSPVYTSKVRPDPHYGESDLAKKGWREMKRPVSAGYHASLHLAVLTHLFLLSSSAHQPPRRRCSHTQASLQRRSQQDHDGVSSDESRSGDSQGSDDDSVQVLLVHKRQPRL